MDFTQFFNPSAWGSWAPPGLQGFLSSQSQRSPNAPVPSGAMTPPPNPPAIAGAMPPPNPPAYTGPTGNIGYGTGVGATGPIPAAPQGGGLQSILQNLRGGGGQGGGNVMQQMALGMLKPQQIQAPQIQMARPVGPGQMPQGGDPAYPPSGWNVSNPPMPGMLNRFGF